MQNKLLKTFALICFVVLGSSLHVSAQQIQSRLQAQYMEENKRIIGCNHRGERLTIGTTSGLDGKFTYRHFPPPKHLL
ncbi:MAG: hypothetical protein U0Z17_02910 [Bacteroidales bacterium]